MWGSGAGGGDAHVHIPYSFPDFLFTEAEATMINKRFFAELTYVSFEAKLTSGSVDIKVGYYITPPPGFPCTHRHE
jgi:hypothetical protein